LHKQIDLPAVKPSDVKQNKLQLLHVVRRYGPVGGMERYVWELTLQLQQLGYDITVVCERCHVDKPAGITVIELGEVAQRPGWLAALRFDRRLARWLAANPQAGRLIHSHERISSHDITTFHGPPFATVFEKPWWKLVSLRVVMRLFQERRELTQANLIVPNSHVIKQQLAYYYPDLAHKLTGPVIPGVTPGVLREQRYVPSDGGVIGFVGKEWQRKGLVLAVAVVEKLRRTRPNLKLVVIGPDTSEVQHLFAGWQCCYRSLGWSEQAPYAEFDVLLHPAKAEPYGMVISEAMAAKVPVVISDVCGAAMHVTSSADAGAVLSLDAPVDAWVAALESQLSRIMPVPQFEHGWREVALESEKIYRCALQQITVGYGRVAMSQRGCDGEHRLT
jgi:UDP-glucose:(heptosyl)LPS alpha-1,3-glucosyltransferase